MSFYGSNQYSSRGEMWDRNMKQRDEKLEEKESQLDICLFLDPNSVRLKAILSWGHVKRNLLLTLPQVLESIQTNMNYIEN